MSFTVIKEYSAVKNYPELGVMKKVSNETLSVTYTAIFVNSVSESSVEVQFSTSAEGIGDGLISFTFPPDGMNDLLTQAEKKT
ncbi:hypothetical protein [Klebsiella quasipneumoniae]|uniref:hypothetical protein n=1 Tax=Klebsiella quasipneumoniae TaxID=1463165 RepID=UPI000DF0D204|nr:hypothetical protein [Klebsiella quasipneumoniae]